MNGRQKIQTLVLMLLVLFGVTATATATTLSLDTGKSLNLEPGGSGVFTFSMTNDEGTLEESFVAWAMGLQVVPVGSVSGTMFFGSGPGAKSVNAPLGTEFTGALAQPSTNPMPFGDVEVTDPFVAQLASGASINGSTTYTLLNITALEFLGTVNSLASYNLGSLTLSASPDAAGTWAVYAVQQGASFYKTHWTNADLEDIDFGNFPRGLSGSNTSLQIGTISVTAVPEPSGLMLAGSAIVAAGWFGWRSRRNPTVVEA